MRLAIAMGVMAVAAMVAAAVLTTRAKYATRRKIGDVNARLRGIAEAHFDDQGVLHGISARNGSQLDFAIRREDERSRRMRGAGQLVELQTGDATFDARHYLECEDPRLAAWLRDDAEARTLIATLVGNGRELAQRDRMLGLLAPDLLDAGHGEVVERARQLHALAKRVPDAAGVVDDSVRERQGEARTVRRLGAGAMFGATLLGGAVYYLGLWRKFPQHVDVLPLLLGASLVGLVVATIAYRAALRRVRGTSHAHRLAQELFATLWVPIVALVVLIVHQVNLRLPLHGVHEESTTILASGSSGGRRGRHSWFELPALGGGEVPAARYTSSGALNAQYRAGLPVVVRWRRGPLASYVLLSAPVPVTPPAAGE